MGKKPPFDPNQTFETVGTAEDAKTTSTTPVQEEPKKPKFDSAKPFVPVDETVKKKDTTPVSPAPGSKDSKTPAEPLTAPSSASTPDPTLEKKDELINKFFEHQYRDWAEGRVKQLQDDIRKNPAKSQEAMDTFEQESNAKVTEFNDTLGKFAKINQERFAKEHSGFLGTLKGAYEEITGSAKTPTKEAPQLNSIQRAIKRGLNLGAQAEIISPFSKARPEDEKLKEVARLQKETQELPASEAYTKFNQSAGVVDALKSFSENPTQIIAELTAESLSALANYGLTRMAVGGGTGAALGSVIPGIGTATGLGSGLIAGLADTSLALEYSGSFMESLQKAGIDVSDTEQLKKAFEDDELISEARSHALKKGIPIAIFDLISGGVAGKITSKPAKSLLVKTLRGGAEFGVQATLGGAGEATGQAVSGEELNAPAILAEMFGELGTTPIEVSANLLGRAKPQAKTEGEVTAPTEDLGKTVDSVIKDRTNVKTTDVSTINSAAEAIQSKVEQNETQAPPPEEVGVRGTGEPKLPEVTPQENTQAQDAQDETKEPLAVEEPSTAEVQGEVVPYTPDKSLPPAKQKVEEKFGKYLNENFESAKKTYKKKFGNVLNADNARELSEDYEEDRSLSSAVHEPSAAFIRKLYQEKLDSEWFLKGEDNRGIFTSGGTGSGKTVSLEGIDTDKVRFVYDGNLDHFETAKGRIDQALKSGVKDIEIRYTYRDPIDAFENGVVKGMLSDKSGRHGRTVPIAVHAQTHIGARENIEKLLKEYKDNENVQIHVIDNSRGKGKAKFAKIGEIPKIPYTAKELEAKLQAITDKLYRDGDITKAQYDGFTIKRRDNSEGVRATSSGETKAVQQTETVNKEVTRGDEPANAGQSKQGVSEGLKPPPPKEPAKTKAPEKGPTRQTKLGERIEKGEPEAVIRDRVKKADEYVRRKIDLTDQEAKDLLKQWNDNEHAERVIRDKASELKPGVRATLAANLYQDYKAQADATTDKTQKDQLHEKAADIGIWAAQNLTRFGQETAIAGKIWKAILQDEDISVIAMERQNLQVAKDLIKPIQEQVTQSKAEFDEQVRRIIEQKVTEGVESRLKKAKLITKEKKREITDFFDSLKVAAVKPGELNDISRVIGVNVWNGSIEAVKRAVLTGADLANAIQAGVDYIKENYKGKDFDEKAYMAMITPAVEQIMPKETVEVKDIDEEKIVTPGIKGKKKTDFIQSVVDAHNDGTLTDDKFEELYAKKIGYKPYTSQEKSKIRDFAKIIAESEKFKAQGREQWSKLNDKLKAAEASGNTAEATNVRKEFEALLDKDAKLLKEAQVANKKMQEFARAPSDIYDTLITIIQGNLLTPMSLVTNVYSNTLLQPLRFGSTAIGTILDKSLSEIAKLGLLGNSYKDRTIDMVALNKGYTTGGWKGAIEGVMQVKTGTLADEKALREIQSGFDPIRAIGRWAESDRAVKQKVNDYIEGTFGIPAEVMFRLLNLGDKPFRRAAEMARAYELGTLKGLKGNDLIGFVAFPDEQSQVEITKAGQEATFQQETAISQGVQKGIQWFLDLTAKVPYIGGALKVLLKSQIPYVKTPLNIAIETVDYAIPPLTLARGIYAYNSGNKRQGNILIGKAIVGGMIIAGTRELFALGLLESDDDDKEKVSKRKESRDLKYETVPPNSINISALMRGLTLHGFERQDGDVSVTFKKMGPMGILMDIHAKDMYSELQEEGKVDNSVNELFLDMFSTAPRVASSALDQSFLRGTNSFLSAVQDAGGYNTEQWIINTLGSVTSIVIPNTLATISKASDEFIRDTYDKDFSDRLKNTYMTKVFLGEGLAPKVNLWGEKVVGSPEGRNKYAFYLFDVTKFQETSTDDFKYKLYKQWKDDAYNDEWLPTMPKRTVSVNGFKIPLSGPDYALLCEYVGKARYSMSSSLIRSRMSKEMKLPELKDAYSEGMSLGKERFLLQKGWKSLSQKALKEMSEK